MLGLKVHVAVNQVQRGEGRLFQEKEQRQSLVTLKKCRETTLFEAKDAHGIMMRDGLRRQVTP